MSNDPKDRDLAAGPAPPTGDGSEPRRRVRLHPREGAEHRFGFARRWESRRNARRPYQIWKLVMMDFGAVLLIYLVARELIRRLGGG